MQFQPLWIMWSGHVIFGGETMQPSYFHSLLALLRGSNYPHVTLCQLEWVCVILRVYTSHWVLSPLPPLLDWWEVYNGDPDVIKCNGGMQVQLLYTTALNADKRSGQQECTTSNFNKLWNFNLNIEHFEYFRTVMNYNYTTLNYIELQLVLLHATTTVWMEAVDMAVLFQTRLYCGRWIL